MGTKIVPAYINSSTWFYEEGGQLFNGMWAILDTLCSLIDWLIDFKKWS